MARISQIMSGLRFRLLLLVVVVCTPLVVVTLETAWQSRRRQVTNWRQRSQRILELADREEGKLLGETRQLLLAVAESSPVRSGNLRSCDKYLGELFASYPRYANFGVLDTNGEVLASALPLAAPVNLTERGFFRRTLQTQAFAISDFQAHAATGKGKATVDFGCPVFDHDGRVQAVVFAALDFSWFNRFSSELPSQLLKASTWTEIDQSGMILVRYPTPEQWIGRPLPERELLNAVFNEPTGLVEAPDSNGVVNVYAFNSRPSQLGAGSVLGILGIPKQVLFAEADRVLARNLSWLGLAVGLALVFGWLGSNLLILRPLDSLVRSTARLARGDFTARTGLPHGHDELGRLTYTFDVMAQTLEQRELERKRASGKLQALSHKLVEVQEAERRYIARELHDEIGQSLTVAEMNLQAALRSPRTTPINARLKDSIEAIERVLEQVKNLSLNLRPSMLDDLGLEPALRWYTQRQAALSGLEAKFAADPLENRMDPVIETECFRVAQEALTNVVRHAQARSVAVELTKRNGDLHLRVRDDGVGFDVAALREQAVRGASLGLLSMEERAALAGGGLEFHSAPGQGTEVRAWFPLKWRLPRA